MSSFMPSLIVALGVVGFAAAGGPDKKDDDVKAELLKLEGTWRLVGLEVGGKAVNPATRYDHLSISETMITRFSGLRVIGGRPFTIDPFKTPKWIDQPDSGLHGLYELKGDKLRLFMVPKDESRPTEFKTKEGTQQTIQTYERDLWPPQNILGGVIPLPVRIVQSDIVVSGRVMAVNPKDVEAVYSSESPYKVDFHIAVVKVEEVIHGPKDVKELRLGFVPYDQDRKVDKTGKAILSLNPQHGHVEVGTEGLFFLRKHHQEAFYVPHMYFNSFLSRPSNSEFGMNLAKTRRLGKVFENPLEALKAESVSNRFLAATMLIDRYRRSGLKANKLREKAIDAEESKMLLKALVEADWQNVAEAISSSEYPPHPYRVFLRLGATKADGYDPPTNDIRDSLKYTQGWLRDNQEKYRIQRFE